MIKAAKIHIIMIIKIIIIISLISLILSQIHFNKQILIKFLIFSMMIRMLKCKWICVKINHKSILSFKINNISKEIHKVPSFHNNNLIHFSNSKIIDKVCNNSHLHNFNLCHHLMNQYL